MPLRSAQLRPAVGTGGRLPRKNLVRRSMVAVGLVVLLGLAKHVISPHESWANSLSALPGGRAVIAGLYIGGMPTDADLQALAGSYDVHGVVNLSGPSVAEQVTAASLHQGYLHLTVVPGDSPSWAQLRTLVGFMRRYTAGGAAVYVHDDVGGARAEVTAEMLLLLRGEPWSAVSRGLADVEQQPQSSDQRLAIQQLNSALDPGHRFSPGNPYAAAQLAPW